MGRQKITKISKQNKQIQLTTSRDKLRARFQTSCGIWSP
ncbi:unnamed protein product [Callosobruchus maculatus]|uniref:Uncharacterized protein n=1 Tax=Callosobruchus maculatus TaxID=64391 RepID=A0A653C3B7_CALMS|nr:unnamed protein product [Callosobruchus maculatus]